MSGSTDAVSGCGTRGEETKQPERGSSVGTAPPGWSRVSFLELGSLPSAVACGRGHVRNVLKEWGVGHLIEDAVLITSELLTNAIDASEVLPHRPPIALRLLANQEQLIVEAWDQSPLELKRFAPDDEDECGRGLLVVAALSNRWGVVRINDLYKAVWAELLILKGNRTNSRPASDLAVKRSTRMRREMQRIPGLLSALVVVAMVSGCAIQPTASNTVSTPAASQRVPTAQATTTSPTVLQVLPTGSSLACRMFTTKDFIQVYGTALSSVTGTNGGSARMGANSDCTYHLSTIAGATVSIELNCGQSAQIFWDEEETENYQNLTGGPPGAVEQLDGDGLPEAMMYTTDGVYLQIDDESVGTTPPGLNPVSDANVTEAMNLAYANVEREKPCR
jgi:anti-sigma regulatory factor (Ser/Thr protein kinase)